MSMIAFLLRIEADELEKMLEDSTILEDKIDTAMDDEMPELEDLDKAWEGVLYMLTGYGIEKNDKALPPLSWALFSGQVVDEDLDLGYGPPNYVTPDQVKEVDTALQKISDEEMTSRFDGKKMIQEGIYPEVWDDPETLDYLLEHFNSLKKFYATAAKHSQAVITFLS